SAMAENDFALKQCDPNFLGAWTTREEIYIKRKNLDDAAKCVERIIAIDAKAPELGQAVGLLVSKCLELNQPDVAVDFLGKLLKLDDAAPQVYYLRGMAFL